MNSSNAQVIIVGGGPIALMAALMLQRLGATVTLVGEAPPIYLPLNPELMLVGGDDATASLFQTSLAHWRNIAETLSLPDIVSTIPAQDLATSVGRADKYRQESMLDAIGGEEVTFHEEPSPISPISRGYKNWDAAPILTPGMLKNLQQAVAGGKYLAPCRQSRSFVGAKCGPALAGTRERYAPASHAYCVHQRSRPAQGASAVGAGIAAASGAGAYHPFANAAAAQFAVGSAAAPARTYVFRAGWP